MESTQNSGPHNVAELLAPGEKTVSFWQCRFHAGTDDDNEARPPTPSRAHRNHHCDELRPAASPPVDNQTTSKVLSPQPVDNFVDSSFSSIWPSLGQLIGGAGR